MQAQVEMKSTYDRNRERLENRKRRDENIDFINKIHRVGKGVTEDDSFDSVDLVKAFNAGDEIE